MSKSGAYIECPLTVYVVNWCYPSITVVFPRGISDTCFPFQRSIRVS